MIILAIESSCDETAAAVVQDGRTVLSSVIASQIDEHRLYGGVVPEIASRRHCENIVGVVDEAMMKSGLSLDSIDAIAVTYAPGLIGALLVGVSFAKGLAASLDRPLIPVHHIKGHIAANYIAHKELKPPYLGLVVSGGHTHIIKVEDYTRFTTIGRTIDDAAGEAFDKAARAMGFPYLKTANPYDFSFSGLKTHVINLIHNCEQRGEALDKNSLAASFQHTVSEILSDTAIKAALDFGFKTVAVSGGVAANSGLRSALSAKCEAEGITLFAPPLSLCGVNAAMIGCQGYYEFLAGNTAKSDLNAIASLPLDC